jgi:hypothetical protein
MPTGRNDWMPSLAPPSPRPFCGGQPDPRSWNCYGSPGGRHGLPGFADRYPVQQAGGKTILELWIPAEDVATLNENIVGRIQVTHEFSRV